MGEAQHRLADAAEGGLLAGVVAPGFLIQQHGADHGLHVAAHALAVVVEGAGHTPHVGGRGVAGDQTLDQLPTDEGADVRMVEEGVQRHLQVGGGAGLAFGDGGAQEALFQGGVVLVVGHHRSRLARVGVGGAVACADEALMGQLSAVPAQAGEDAGQADHVVIAVGGNGIAPSILLRRAIQVQLLKPDGEELHHFAGVVLVGRLGDLAGRVKTFLAVADVRQVHAHHGVQGDVLQQLAEVAKGAADQRVVVADQPLGVFADHSGGRHHEDLRQREGHALAQLVLLNGGNPPGVVGVLQFRDIFVALGPPSLAPVPHGVQQREGRTQELRLDPFIGSPAGEGLDVLRVGTVTGLSQEAARLGWRGERPAPVARCGGCSL